VPDVCPARWGPGTRFLAKPFDMGQTVRLVRELLDLPSPS